jgi:RHS repeat-associated protein
VTSEQLYSPYGNGRYTTGTSPTSLGYTGQRADASTGLDYYQARYYDPVAGQFISADSVADGLNRYGYVKGNPATYTDPAGHSVCPPNLDPSKCVPAGGGDDGSGSGSGPTIVSTDTVTTNDNTRGEDGWLTTITTTTKVVHWSDGQVTTTTSKTTSRRCDNECHRIQHLNDLHGQAAGWFLGGTLMQIAAVVLELTKAALLALFDGIIEVAGLLLNALPYAATAFGASSGFFQALSKIAAVFDNIAGLAQAARAAYYSLGLFAQGLLEGSTLMIKTESRECLECWRCWRRRCSALSSQWG